MCPRCSWTTLDRPRSMIDIDTGIHPWLAVDSGYCTSDAGQSYQIVRSFDVRSSREEILFATVISQGWIEVYDLFRSGWSVVKLIKSQWLVSSSVTVNSIRHHARPSLFFDISKTIVLKCTVHHRVRNIWSICQQSYKQDIHPMDHQKVKKVISSPGIELKRC